MAISNEVISAISTPQGRGGVAIIRLSGEGALNVAAKMFRPTGKVAVEGFAPNVMYTGEIICDGFNDFGLCVYFKAPKSFTGEDVVEFHCHGGTQIARGVFAATCAAGARPAAGGEFTKRAFVNGKLSLASAEGMIDMINAESLAEVRAGSLLYAERLTRAVTGLQEQITSMLAEIAADIDYPEEGVAETKLSDIGAQLRRIKDGISALASQYARAKFIKSGVTVAICGKPNVGKSSLLNALLGYDKAIVSPSAGTTRDAVEGEILIDGIKYLLFDTAGIRERAGEIEAIGIQRAKKIVGSADVTVCLADDGDFSVAEGSGAIRVASKCDAVTPRGEYDIAVSSQTGEGIEQLKKELSARSVGSGSLEQAFVIEERHHDALSRAESAIDSAICAVQAYPPDIVAIDINEAWSALGEISGQTANEKIIDTVFAKFCVGK